MDYSSYSSFVVLSETKAPLRSRLSTEKLGKRWHRRNERFWLNSHAERDQERHREDRPGRGRATESPENFGK